MKIKNEGMLMEEKKRFPESAYIGRTREENIETMAEVLEITKVVTDILSDTLNNTVPLSEACRSRGIDYIRFRRFCERFLQVKYGGRAPKGIMPEYEPSIEEKVYSLIFGVPEGAAIGIMPEDAEESVERVLSELREQERDVLCRRLDGESLVSIGERYGLSRERMRQVEAKALRKLRHPTRVKILTNGVTAYLGEIAERERRAKELNDAIDEQRRLEAIRQAELQQSLYGIDIAEFDPSVRLYNVLKRAGINKVSDLFSWDWERLRNLRNMGIGTLDELRRHLDEWHIKLPERM